MADLMQSLYYELANTSGVTDLTATAPDGSTEGIYIAGDVQQGAEMPFLTLQVIINTQERDQSGESGLDQTSVQLTAVAETEREAKLLRDAVVAALSWYRGDMGESGSTVTIRRALHQNDTHTPVPPSDGGQRGAHMWATDFLFWTVTA